MKIQEFFGFLLLLLIFYLKIFSFLEVKFSTYLNRRVFVMDIKLYMCLVTLKRREDFNSKTGISSIENDCSNLLKSSRKHAYIILTP